MFLQHSNKTPGNIVSSMSALSDGLATSRLGIFLSYLGGLPQRLGSQWINNRFNFYEGNPINLHDPLLQCLGRFFLYSQ